MLDLPEWIGPTPRPYTEVLDAWRTSCPRLPVGEEANVRGYLDHFRDERGAAIVCVSPAGIAHLASRRVR